MARTLDEDGSDRGATMFLVDMDAPGFRIVRQLDTLDNNSPGGHAEVEFDEVRVGSERILGQVGHGFRNAQVRLGPARLTHCMRWLGAARRCHAIAADYARRRHAFGKLIGEHQGVCKVFCSEALGRVVDRSLQILGGLGITADTVVERIYRDIRAFRIYDGPSEVHRFALARAIMSGDPALADAIG
jgi:acyl-CoA dehydrogenase